MGDDAEIPGLEALRHTLAPDVGEGTHTFIDDHCANCLDPLALDIDGLFCGSWCRETAELVRYWRGTIRDGRIEDPLVAQAFRTRVAFVLVGGYEQLGRRLAPSRRAEVRIRAEGRCQGCGKPGDEVDHIDGDSPELSNLQVLCGDCHRSKTSIRITPAPKAEAALVRSLFVRRVVPLEPTLLADDQAEWRTAWQGLRRARKQRVVEQMQDLGIDIASLKSRGEMILVLSECMPELMARVPTERSANH